MSRLATLSQREKVDTVGLFTASVQDPYQSHTQIIKIDWMKNETIGPFKRPHLSSPFSHSIVPQGYLIYITKMNYHHNKTSEKSKYNKTRDIKRLRMTPYRQSICQSNYKYIFRTNNRNRIENRTANLCIHKKAVIQRHGFIQHKKENVDSIQLNGPYVRCTCSLPKRASDILCSPYSEPE